MQQASSFQLNSFNLVFFAVEVVAARDYAACCATPLNKFPESTDSLPRRPACLPAAMICGFAMK
jgi:hypothetical protein